MKTIEPDDVVAEMPDIDHVASQAAVACLMDMITSKEDVVKSSAKIAVIFCMGAQYAMKHMESKKAADELLKGYQNAKID